MVIGWIPPLPMLGSWKVRLAAGELLGIEGAGFTLMLLYNPPNKKLVCPRQWLHPHPIPPCLSSGLCFSVCFPPYIPVKGQEQLRLSPGVFPADLHCNTLLKPTLQTNLQLARVLTCMNQNQMKYYSWENTHLLLRL